MPYHTHHAHHGKPSHQNNAGARPHHPKAKHAHHNKMGCHQNGHAHKPASKFHEQNHTNHNKMGCHQKIDITTQDQEGNTALHIALKNHNYNTAIKLIKYGADMNAQNNKGETALHIVSKQHHPHASKMATILIEHGADVNIPLLANCKAKEGAQEISSDQTEIADNLDHTEHLLESNNQTDLVLNGQNDNLDLAAAE